MTVKVVAEAGQCMGGSIPLAIEMAEAAAQAGAYGFKVQLLDPVRIATATAPKYWADDYDTHNQREAFTKAGLVDYRAWRHVKDACDSFGIEFFATPFDLKAVEALEGIGVRLYKVASGDITYRPLLEQLNQTRKPIVLSTGAATRHEILDALSWLNECEVTLLACTLSYPTPNYAANLARITSLQDLGEVGYSDHTTGVATALGAAVLGAVMLEKHFTHDNTASDVPDHAMALEPLALREYVRLANLGAELRGNPSLGPVEVERDAWFGARRGIYAARDMAAGEVLRFSDLAFLRPQSCASPGAYREFVGSRLLSDVLEGDDLAWAVDPVSTRR